jgi:hypothetical protein
MTLLLPSEEDVSLGAIEPTVKQFWQCLPIHYNCLDEFSFSPDSKMLAIRWNQKPQQIKVWNLHQSGDSEQEVEMVDRIELLKITGNAVEPGWGTSELDYRGRVFLRCKEKCSIRMDLPGHWSLKKWLK